MKKKLMIGLGTALLLALAGCGSSGNSSEKAEETPGSVDFYRK